MPDQLTLYHSASCPGSKCESFLRPIAQDDNSLELSGLTAGRPARTAIRLIDVCLSLETGEALISRAEDSVVEVLDVDRENWLVTLRHPRGPRTIAPLELSREYERLATDDFRVERVQVAIFNSDGKVVEQGDAVQQANAIDWVYTATAENESTEGDKIVISASDKPGHVTTQEATM